MAETIFVIYTVSPGGFEEFICYYDTLAEAEKYILIYQRASPNQVGFMINEVKKGEWMRVEGETKSDIQRTNVYTQLDLKFKTLDTPALRTILSYAETLMEITDPDYQAVNAESRKDNRIQIDQSLTQREADERKIIASLLLELETILNNPLQSFVFAKITDPVINETIKEMRVSLRLVYELLKTLIKEV